MGRIKRQTIKFTLEKELNSLMLNSQQVYDFVGEESEEDLEFALFIDKYCEYLNWHTDDAGHNKEMAFGDLDYERLHGWLKGYIFAKKYNVIEEKGHVYITTKRFEVILPVPFDI